MKKYTKHEKETKMKKSSYGIELNALKLDEKQRHQFARMLVLSPLFTTEQIGELINKRLKTMTCEEQGRLFDLLKQNVHETIRLFESLGLNKLRHKVYQNLVEKVERIEQISSSYLSLSELKDLAESYSVRLSDLMQDEGHKYVTPTLIVDYLDEYVAGQAEAKRAVALVFYSHMLRIGKLGLQADASMLPHLNLMLLGPTGSGKTYMMKLIASFFGIPFTIMDLGSVTSTGYVGEKVDSAFTNLIISADGDYSQAEKGIVIFDEFDKIATKQQDTIGSTEVQQEILKKVEGCEINVSSKHGRDYERQKFDTSNICFMFAGVFQGIDKIVTRRVGIKTVGFNATALQDTKNCYSQINSDDLISFGLIPELVGRISKIVSLGYLTRDDIRQIIDSKKNSALSKYMEYFRLHKVDLNIDPEVYDVIACKVVEKGLGARYIENCLGEILSGAFFEAPMLKGSKISISKEDAVRKLNY